MADRRATPPLSGEENVATRIKREREARGWSTTAVSDRMNAAGYAINPSAVWRIENHKRRVHLDEAIGFAEIFGLDLRGLVVSPQLAATARALELIDATVDAFRASLRANAAYAEARNALDGYLVRHPDIRRTAESVFSDAMTQAARGHMAQVARECDSESGGQAG